VVTALLAVTVAGTILRWVNGSSTRSVTEVRGVVGSDLNGFFADPRVRAEFARRGLDVHVTTAANGSSGSAVDPPKYDFTFGTSAPSSTKGQARASTVPFVTPITVATSTDVARTLQRAGVAHDHGGWWRLDMNGFLDLVARHATSSVPLTTTEFTASSSPAMYASIASYVANHDRVLDSPASVDAVVNQVSPLFLEQRHAAPSTAALLEYYLSKGGAAGAMILVPEAAFVARATAHDPAIGSNTVLVYPDPNMVTKYRFVPMSGTGAAVGHLLGHDQQLQQLAADHGLRSTSRPASFASVAREHRVAAEPTLGRVIEPPTPAVLSALMTRIDAALHVGLGPRSDQAAANE